MSDNGRSFAREGCGADPAAYALGALEPADADAFERHMNECDECAEALAGFEQVVETLAMTAPQYPVPPGLRRRVMGGVRSEPRRSDAGPRRRRWVPMAFLSRHWRARATLGTAVAVGLASVALAIATLVSGGSGGVRALQARVIDSAGSAQMRLTAGRAELIVRHFPAPAAGHIYEVWLKRAGRAPKPTQALFSVNAQGAGDIGVPGALKGVDEILVTEEPAGGSLAPTRQPVIIRHLT